MTEFITTPLEARRCLIDLASNTNALGAAPHVVAAIRRTARASHTYPNPDYPDLCELISAHLKVTPEEVLLGSGSDGIIQLLGRLLLSPDTKAIIAAPAFSRYADAATLNHSECKRVSLTADGVHDLDAMLDAIDPHTRLVFITNPHNPTGTILKRDQLNHFLNNVPEHVVVAIDEAYHEYAADNASYPDTVEYVREGRNNVVILRTMSKIHALAGLRVGYAAMSRQLALRCKRYREPFNLTIVSEAAAIATLSDQSHVTAALRMNEEGKVRLYSAFEAIGLDYTRTHANFVWVNVGCDSRRLATLLAERDILVQPGDSFDALTHLRITIGSAGNIELFINALQKTLRDCQT